MHQNRKWLIKPTLIAGRIGKTLEHFVSAFKSIEEEEWQSVYLANLYSKIKSNDGPSISGKIQQLSGLVNKLNYRLNLVVNFIMNILFLWNIKQVIAIEDWKKANHQNFETAFDAIAEFEAIISLAGLRINYPGLVASPKLLKVNVIRWQQKIWPIRSSIQQTGLKMIMN